MAKWTLTTAALFLAFIIGGAEARLLWPFGSIEEMNRVSDRVVHIRIESASTQTAHGVECGTLYIVSNLEVFKAGTADEAVSDRVFDRHQRLSAGQEYILFLSKTLNIESVFDRLGLLSDSTVRSGNLTAKERDIIRCNREIPDFELGSFSAWPLAKENRVLIPVPPRWWPPTIRVLKGRIRRNDRYDIISRSDIIVSREDVTSYLHEIQTRQPHLELDGEPLFPVR
jgi:hypothetical protein